MFAWLYAFQRVAGPLLPSRMASRIPLDSSAFSPVTVAALIKLSVECVLDKLSLLSIVRSRSSDGTFSKRLTSKQQ